MKPEELLDQLKINSSQKVQVTLEAIYEVCGEQVKQGINDFSVSTIARIGAHRGVPKAQSIRNKSGEKYRALIECFAQNNAKAAKAKVTENWIDEIKSPKHRLLVQMMAAELAETKQKVNEIVPPNKVVHVYDHGEPISEFERLNPIERRALDYILSDSFMKKWYLTTTEFGEMTDDSGKVVFKPGTVDALKKALRYL
ncbi:hypothetical protein HHX48_08210 [Salinimonas sp. HHU 13199]|uniref:Uncharacterized protein n=1 Tax=Salinimonas profundi TaxID=2729140 RepID=A0ABR8LJF7_9ALTE|nr:gamma-mobile-trio protein GmtX [Salinimonas profundi]MBD3585713.1 hypothetical protein [Salinimonas profundi]